MENGSDKFFEVNSHNNSVVRSFSLKACLEMATPASSTLAERLSVNFNDNVALVSVCKDIALEVQLGELKLSTFVEELGSFVTNKDVSVREGGVTALSSVLSELPNDFLNETELHFITVFFCDRLKDHHSIIPVVLRGILAIVQMIHLPQDAPVCLFTKMFEHVQCQSQLLQDRRNIYLIFATLLQSRLNDLKKMGPDFVYGVISSIDGERDPRNLMLLFNILPNFIKEFPLGHLAEEMFEVISCYFPIDFNPVGSDVIGITREDLAESLAPCLYAIPEFVEFCIPLISDKLSSNLKVAKLDSLHLLRKGAYVFGVNGLEPYLSELWPIIRKEVMSGGDSEIKNATLKTLAVLIEVISADEKVHETFIEKILTDIKMSLCDVQLSLFRPAENLLESVAMVNKQTCIYVLRVIVPICLGQYSTKNLLMDKVIIMDALNNFMKIASDLDFSIKNVPELTWTDIPQLYFEELSKQSTELRIKILIGLTIQRAYLKETHRILLYDIICNEIDTGCEEMRNICQACLAAFANLYSNEVLLLVQEKLQIDKDDIDVKVKIRRLQALSIIAKIPELANEILPKVLGIGNSPNSEISLAALKCIHKLVSIRNSTSDVQYFLYNECNIIDKLISFTTNTSTDKLSLISSICQCIVRGLFIEDQQMITDKYIAIITHNTCENVVTVIISLLISLRQEVKLILDDSLLESLYNLAVNSSNSITRTMSCQLLSVVLNKMNNAEHFKNSLIYLQEKIKKNLESTSNVDTKKKTVILYIWLTKAAVTKGSYNSQDCLNILTEMLKHNEVGEYVAQEYKSLTCKMDSTLTSENFCNIKIFYKQRVFQHLLQQNNSFLNNSRQNFLIALTYLIEEMPTELLYMHLSELVFLLIESLSLDNGQLVLSALIVLKLLLDTKNEIFADKMQCFIPKLLELSTYKLMDIRITALDCLTSYTNYSAVLINVYKPNVLEKLKTVLDDKKRLVRKAAVKARTRWFLVCAPGGIKDQ
ncbi:MMS19 nucleotide excision repair protein homolog isoform X1 [Vespa mandarinia]|uniref:MMS19 nucleotide excision repair protein homolog isoform X1 n=2 Tax=Vespa mandarinia TaxID=7446 RepID=UPI00161485B0|nr:MMS19 nucleotide excision repair protein homolog isoform X1 [Vespa mandarinia]XP_035736210.1 MMS19 nucleotide excision repair protein homolog isoform X1 [Vespa mandarinia]